jgi:hypothetical protein
MFLGERRSAALSMVSTGWIVMYLGCAASGHLRPESTAGAPLPRLLEDYLSERCWEPSNGQQVMMLIRFGGHPTVCEEAHRGCPNVSPRKTVHERIQV